MTLPDKSYLSIVNMIHTSKFLRLSTLNWQQVAVQYVSEGRILTCPPISYHQISPNTSETTVHRCSTE